MKFEPNIKEKFVSNEIIIVIASKLRLLNNEYSIIT